MKEGGCDLNRLPIRHAHRVRAPHGHYQRFIDHGVPRGTGAGSSRCAMSCATDAAMAADSKDGRGPSLHRRSRFWTASAISTHGMADNATR
jgi:hypothetical protein